MALEAPSGAIALVLVAGAGLLIWSASTDNHVRVTGKTERPGCHQLTLTKTDATPPTRTTLCVSADDYQRVEIGFRWTGPTS